MAECHRQVLISELLSMAFRSPRYGIRCGRSWMRCPVDQCRFSTGPKIFTKPGAPSSHPAQLRIGISEVRVSRAWYRTVPREVFRPSSGEFALWPPRP